ncbi:M13 family metallopeptidase [Coralloluteibacterium thermophilus]|uniref:M13 family metallopeptidase n=1 Tax=Coralloluteibacterium thermophilum TaxID=2707049 RepID=A0ABV9NLS3_9GAMM
MHAPRPLALALALGLFATATDSNAQRRPAQPAAPAVPAYCSDFYTHVNKPWLDANPLPYGATSFGQLDQINALALEQQRELLQAAATSPQTPAQRVLGDFWASGLDTAAIEAAGLTAIQPLLDRIAAVRRPGQLGAAIADLHAQGVPVLFNFSADIDLQDFSRTIGYASQGGLGLPDPDYYTRTDADAQALLGRYRSYVEQILRASGTPEAELSEQSARILEVEIQLARGSARLEALRDPRSAYNPVAVRDLARTYPRLDLRGFLRTQNVSADSIVVMQPEFFAQADRLLQALPLEQWQAYLRFQVLSAFAPYLGQAWLGPYFELYGTVLRGIRQAPPREVLLMDFVINPTVGELLGQEYAARHVSAETEQAVVAMGEQLRAAMGRAIEGSLWLGEEAKAEAAAKLEKLEIEVARPERRNDLAALQLDRADFAGNVLKVAAERHRQEMALIGRQGEVERRWPTLPQVPDVSYILDENKLVVTAAMLQPPVFDLAADPAANYGALGALMANQMSHAFDNAGSHVDASGTLRTWWSEADGTAYEQRIKPLVDQYDQFSPAPGIRVRGAQTRFENAADLAGLELALDAWKTTVPDAGREATQRFFEAWAKVWAQHYSEQELRLRVATGVQAPAQYRVNGPLANLPAFAESFGCQAGQPMVVADPAQVWR